MSTFLGWRKALKCKKLVKQVRSRLECMRKERTAILAQLQTKWSQWTENNNALALDQEALKVSIDQEQRIRDETLVYGLLDHFCKKILKRMNFLYIRTHKKCPHQGDLGVAVSTLVFASSRLRSKALPELEEIKELFAERYGEDFVETAGNLLPGNLVSPNFQKHILALFPEELDDVKQEPVKPSRSSTEIKNEDENHHKQLQPVSLKHVHPKLPDCDDIFLKFSALKKPKFVHPKLPEYDEITAKFKALKRLNKLEDHHQLQPLEYQDDQEDYTDDAPIFSISWLALEKNKSAMICLA